MLPKLNNETDSIILDKILAHSFYGYTFYIKQYMINNYNAVYTIDNCYIVLYRGGYYVSGNNILNSSLLTLCTCILYMTL